MNRKRILDNLKSDYDTFAASDSRDAPEKTAVSTKTAIELNEERNPNSVVLFRFGGGGDVTMYIENDVADEVDQPVEALVYVQKSGGSSVRKSRYDRMLDVGDQVFDWINQAVGNSVDSQLCGIRFVGWQDDNEEDGYFEQTALFNVQIERS